MSLYCPKCSQKYRTADFLVPVTFGWISSASVGLVCHKCHHEQSIPAKKSRTCTALFMLVLFALLLCSVFSIPILSFLPVGKWTLLAIFLVLAFFSYLAALIVYKKVLISSIQPGAFNKSQERTEWYGLVSRKIHSHSTYGGPPLRSQTLCRQLGTGLLETNAEGLKAKASWGQPPTLFRRNSRAGFVAAQPLVLVALCCRHNKSQEADGMTRSCFSKNTAPLGLSVVRRSAHGR